MFSYLPIGGIEVGFVATGTGDRISQVIRDEDFRDSLKELKGMNMRLNPGGKILREGGFGEGVIAGPQGGYKDLSLMDLSRFRIDDGDRLPGIIDEELLSGSIFLPEAGIKLLGPLMVEMAELIVLVPVRMLFFVFIPEKLKGHPFFFNSWWRYSMGGIWRFS